jgi:predicted ArsR family transcriptional regulator
MSTSRNTDAWADVHLLAEPTRRSLYDAVRRSAEPLTRDDVAAATGVGRRLVAFHLDLLADAGLLDVDYARPPGRGGPGAGRPAKRYRAGTREIAVTVPGRRYELAARVLATGIRDAGPRGDAGGAALAAAEVEGRRLGALRRPARSPGAARTLACAAAALEDLGYDPAYDGSTCIRLRNCPFHALVDVSPELVCGMNERFLGGLLDGLGGAPSVSARLAPSPPDCCVTIGA